MRYNLKAALAVLATFFVIHKNFPLRVSRLEEVNNGGQKQQLRGGTYNPRSLASPFTHRRRLTESDPLRFAWGIVSQPHDEEIREVLRKTYLNDPRICILGDDSSELHESCKIAYTFVLPLHILEDYGSLAPSSPDIAYLPVNTEQSLISSWFRYAATLDVDYVAKIDATTLVFPDRFLDMAQDMLGSPLMYRVIGGMPRDRWDCGGFSKWKCRQMKGRTFMSPELYFMSTDLAARAPLHILDEEPDRLSNWLAESLPQFPTMQVTIQPSHGLWEKQPLDATSSAIQQRWDYLKSRKYSRQLVRVDNSAAPRWNGTSLLDEFYRRIPWKYLPDSLTRFNLL